MVVRKITSAGGRKLVSKFPSIKLGRVVRCESPLERDYVYLLEHGKAKFYEEQPLRIWYYLNGKKRRYTPDFLVESSNKKQIVEVKPVKVVVKAEFQALFHTISQICRQEGYEFLVVTDEMIRVQPRLANIKILYRYAKVPIFPDYQLEYYEFLKEEPRISIRGLANFLSSRKIEDSLSVVYALSYWGFLEIDLTKPVNSTTLVSLPTTVSQKEAC